MQQRIYVGMLDFFWCCLKNALKDGIFQMMF